MGGNIFPVGSRVRVTSESPFRGLKGTIEKQLGKSDFELGLEALLRMANGEDPLKG